MSSRQREWQRRMQEEGRCIICGDVAEVPCYCDLHLQKRREKLKARRIRDQRCSNCGEIGHNRRTCPYEIVERVQRCSNCGGEGHNRRTCPMEIVGEE